MTHARRMARTASILSALLVCSVPVGAGEEVRIGYFPMGVDAQRLASLAAAPEIVKIPGRTCWSSVHALRPPRSSRKLSSLGFVRLTAVVLSHTVSAYVVHGDAVLYDELARNLANGAGFTPCASRRRRSVATGGWASSAAR